MRDYLVPAWLVALLAVLVLSCSSGPDPRSAVIDFLQRDMFYSDTLAISEKLEVQSVLAERKSDLLAEGDSARAERYTVDSLIGDLTSGGELHRRWLSHQIIVSEVIQKGDSAEVEVSFIDAVRSVQYYNRMGLHLVDGKWKIYSFKTLK
jgi:hypothetical protein